MEHNIEDTKWEHKNLSWCSEISMINVICSIWTASKLIVRPGLVDLQALEVYSYATHYKSL